MRAPEFILLVLGESQEGHHSHKMIGDRGKELRLEEEEGPGDQLLAVEKNLGKNNDHLNLLKWNGGWRRNEIGRYLEKRVNSSWRTI